MEKRNLATLTVFLPLLADAISNHTQIETYAPGNEPEVNYFTTVELQNNGFIACTWKDAKPKGNSKLVIRAGPKLPDAPDMTIGALKVRQHWCCVKQLNHEQS